MLGFATPVACLSLALTAVAGQQKLPAPPPEVAKGFSAISLSNAKRNLSYLAGPECEGRGTGQPGYDKAAAYVAGKFKALGLKTVPGLDGYFQKAPFYRVSLESARVSSPKGSVGMEGIYVPSPNADVSVNAPVSFVNVDSRATISDLTPFAGKVVIVRSAETPRRALNQLSNSDAKAVLLLVDKAEKNVPLGQPREPRPGRVPVLQISRPALARVLGASASELDSISEAPEITIDTKVKSEQIQVANVVAMLPGSDPKMKAEFVGIGAHLDHLGRRGDTIWYGADDDGSGSTALIETATAFAKNRKKPRRSIIFMAFFGEELGLLGSNYLTSNPPVDLTKMVAEFQMDMVGRDSDGVQNGDRNRVDKADENRNTMRLVGSKRISTELDKTIQDQNAYVGFTFKYDAEDVYTRSDHYMFARKGIPIAFFFDGFHPDYHQPTDTVDKINFVKLTNAAKLCYLSAMQVANRDLPPVHDVPQPAPSGE